jgi:hypothetical protein
MKCSCGSNLFYENVRVGGWWCREIDGQGEILDTHLENVRYSTTPKTVVCIECGKRCDNPNY